MFILKYLLREIGDDVCGEKKKKKKDFFPLDEFFFLMTAVKIILDENDVLHVS